MKQYFSTLAQKSLWHHISLGIGASILLLTMGYISLSFITKHNETTLVPSVVGVSIYDAQQILNHAGMVGEVTDSIFLEDAKPFSVVRQIPVANAIVKVGRVVYLTVNRASAPIVRVPNLVGLSFSNAVSTLESVGLNLGDTIYVAYFARDFVLKQILNTTVAAGTMVKLGTKITLVLGDGTDTK